MCSVAILHAMLFMSYAVLGLLGKCATNACEHIGACLSKLCVSVCVCSHFKCRTKLNNRVVFEHNVCIILFNVFAYVGFICAMCKMHSGSG